MDDNFNNDNNYQSPDEQNNTPADATEEPKSPDYGYTPANDSYNKPTDGCTPANDSYGKPADSYNSNNGYNSTPNNSYGYSQNNYGNRPNTYSTSPNQSNYQQQSYGNYGQNQTPNYNQPPFGIPNNNNNNGKKKNSTGKAIFAIIVCICVVVASIGIGSAIKASKTGNDNTSSKTEEKVNEDAPKLNSGSSEVEEETTTKSGEALSKEAIYEKVKDINVGVKVYSNSQQAGEGSGIIAAADGTYTYIITCAHVISSDYDVQIEFNDGTEIDAEIVGYDTKTDVGVLKIKKTGLTVATFADSDKLKVGNAVYAIGNPGGSEFFGTFTDGMVTAIDRPVSTSNSAYDLPCIQHNAAINPGNSGGALVNEYGEVVGLNSSKIASTEYEGMGFAVPVNTVKEIYSDIVEHGYVTNRPKLGITYYAVSSNYTYSAIAWKNDLPYGSIVIQEISSNSSFTGTNVEAGDIITSVNGKDLESTDILLEIIENSKVGDTLTIGICRLNNNGSVNKQFTVKVKLVEDKGDTITEQQTTEASTDNYNYYFPFGY